MRKNRFREDLYYRLNVVKVDITPLRKRHEDIPLLADFFLQHYVEKNRKLIKGFTPRATDMLMHHNWPGNVRELENVIERAMVMARGDMIRPAEFPKSIAHLDSEVGKEGVDFSTGRTLKEVEREMIIRTLEEAGGNRSHKAKILGISRRTLQLKLKEYGID